MLSWHGNFVLFRKNVNFGNGKENSVSYKYCIAHIFLVLCKSLITGNLSRLVETVLYSDLSV